MTKYALIYELSQRRGRLVRLYLNNKHYATFQQIYAERWLKEHKAIIWNIQDVLDIKDNGEYIDVFCSRFE